MKHSFKLGLGYSTCEPFDLWGERDLESDPTPLQHAVLLRAYAQHMTWQLLLSFFGPISGCMHLSSQVLPVYSYCFLGQNMDVGSRLVVGPQQRNFETTPIFWHTILKAGRARSCLLAHGVPMVTLKKWWGHCPLAHALPTAMQKIVSVF
jgi:hypothetical protein